MKNLIIVCLFLITFTVFSGAVQAQNVISENKKKLIDEIIVLSKSDQQFVEITDKMLEAMEKMSPLILTQTLENNEELSPEEKKKITDTMDVRFKTFSKKFRERFPQRIDTKKYVEDLLYPIYDKFFTEKELTDLIAFYKSETGQKFISVTPQLVEETNKITQSKLLPQVLNLVEEIIKEEFPEIDNQKNGMPPPPPPAAAPPPGKKPNK